MRASDVYGGNSYTAEEVTKEGITLTIDRVKMKTFDDGKDKLVLSFAEVDKSLIVNNTNYQVIKGLYGDETDDWEGKEIGIYQTRVMYNAKMVPAIRVRDRVPGAVPARPAATGKGRKVEMMTQAEADNEPDSDEDVPF